MNVLFYALSLLAQSKITSKLKLDYFLAIFHKLHKVTLSYCRAHTDEIQAHFMGYNYASRFMRTFYLFLREVPPTFIFFGFFLRSFIFSAGFVLLTRTLKK